MIDFDYLYKGLCGLANAHRAGTMAGHLGAAVVAGYLFGEDQSDLPAAVHKGVEGELDRVIAGEESFWWNARKAGVTSADLFKDLSAGTTFSTETARQDAIRSIVMALQQNVGTLKQSGHNVIFAALTVRALHDHEEYVTPQMVSGIRRLTAGFNSVAQGRGYFGSSQGWKTGDQVQFAADTDFPAYQSVAQMVDVTIRELIGTAAVRKQGFGGLWHIINHAAAITELERFGYRETAQQALPAHHHHIRLWRSLPDVADELQAVVKSVHDPREPVYWEGMLKRDEARLTHRIKTLYGFYTILRFVEDADTRHLAQDAFLYLMD